MTVPNNVHALGYSGAVMANPDKPVVQATLVFQEDDGQGFVTIISDSIQGGTALCKVTPELAKAINDLVDEVNEQFNS